MRERKGGFWAVLGFHRANSVDAWLGISTVGKTRKNEVLLLSVGSPRPGREGWSREVRQEEYSREGDDTRWTGWCSEKKKERLIDKTGWYHPGAPRHLCCVSSSPLPATLSVLWEQQLTPGWSEGNCGLKPGASHGLCDDSWVTVFELQVESRGPCNRE